MKIKSMILVLFVIISGYGQERKELSLTTFLNKVKSENLSLKKSVQEIEQFKADFVQSNALFLPNISASHTAMVTTNPLMAFGSKLNQGILTPNDFNPNLLNNPVATRNFATIIKIEQPILNLDGLFQRKAAKNALDAKKLEANRKTDYIITEAKKVYMQLQLTYEGLEVFKNAKKLIDQLQVQTANFYKEGLIQKSDVLSVEIRKVEIDNGITSTESQIINLSNFISFLMNEKGTLRYAPAENLQLNMNTNFSSIELPKDRSDLKAMELATTSRKNMMKSEKMSYLPRLNAFGSYELYDNQIFQGGSSGYVVGAQLSWDIFKGSKRVGKIQKTTSQYEESKLALEEYQLQSQIEFTKTKQALVDAERNVKLSKLTLEQSQEVLRIKSNRFKEGLEKATDVLAIETKVIQKQFEYLQAIYNYNHINNYLEFLTKEN
ncbi:MAG: TolC family protein [Polaribacter sp.]